MALVLLGNTSVATPLAGAQASVNGRPIDSVDRPDLGQQITTVSPPTDAPIADRVAAVAAAFAAHSTSPAAWVESDDAELTAAVADHYGCPVGCPVDHNTWLEG
jgi:hypothetical protein